MIFNFVTVIVAEVSLLNPPGLMIKLTKDRLKGKIYILILEHGSLIETGPKKWPKQATFILFRQRNNKHEKN